MSTNVSTIQSYIKILEVMIVPMDLKTFAEDHFDVKKVINKAWSASGNQEKEVFVANAVSRLQLYMKQLTNALDEATTQIVTSLPRVINEASVLQEEGVILQEKLLSLERKVVAVEGQTGHSIQSLQRVDKLKSKLEAAASALHEADKWAALTSALESILEDGVPTARDELAELADKVTAMTQSLEVLSESPDYDAKRVQLETLYNRLEAAISPSFIDALTQMDADRTSSYVRVFGGMSRENAARACWRRAAAARLAAAWRALPAHSEPALSRLLASHADTQIEWLTNVLQCDTPIAGLVQLYTDLLLSLDPSPTKVASASLKLCSNSDESILLLVDLRKDIDNLVSAIGKIIEASTTSTQDEFQPNLVQEFGRAAYAPLRDLLPKYTELQTQVLTNYLDTPNLKQEDLVEYSRGVLSITERCGGWLEAGFSRANKIAGVAAYPFYLNALENFVTSLTSIISTHARTIESEFVRSVSAGEAAGVLAETFPAALLLQSAADTLLDTVAHRHNILTEEIVFQDLPPLEDLPSLLLDPEAKKRLLESRSGSLQCTAALSRARDHLAALARNILKEPVDSQLEKVPTLPVWNNNDALTTHLPDYALSPQQYITEIGQYLMTLPQHLEMHISEKQAPWQYLSEVCVHTCEVYAEKILAIRNMDELGTKRCLTDIVYISSVVEDLGSNVAPALKNLEMSLRAAPNQASAENAL